MQHKSAQVLIVTVLFLVALGVTMLSSTSVFGAHASAEDAYYDVKRQVTWVGLGALSCLAFALVDYHWWQRTAAWWFGLAALLLALCFVPNVGLKINGEYRWISAEIIGLRGFQIQPSEFAKLAMAVTLGAWYDRHPDEEQSFVRGFLIPSGFAAVLVLLIAGEVDIGTAVIVGAGAFALMYLAGANWKYLAASLIVAAAAFAALVLAIPNRRIRVMAMLDPDAHQSGVMLQQYLATLAFGSGGVEGLGLGSGRLKMLYMPFAHTDFIFPMIGEELGLVFSLAVVLSFVLLVVFGMLIALHAPDRFGRLLASGIICGLSIQAILNIGVTTAVLPNTGIPLPFVSYGGSSLLCALAGIGILINIFRQGSQTEAEKFPRILRTKLTPRV